MLPRVAASKVAQYLRRSAMSKTTVLSSINSIHTKKQPDNIRSRNIKSMKSTKPSSKTSSRWFSAIPLPSLPFSIYPQSLIQSIGILTGDQAMSTKNDRMMKRVWQKRKQKLYKATSVMLDSFETDNMTFESAQVYIRASGSFDDGEDNAQKEVHIALRGIAHTVVVLRCGAISYLLDRVVEGIRLTPLEINQETQTITPCNKFKPKEMVKLATFKDIDVSSAVIAEWIHEESQTEYDVITNNCVWFSFYFWRKFLCGLRTQRFIDSMKHNMCA